MLLEEKIPIAVRIGVIVKGDRRRIGTIPVSRTGRGASSILLVEPGFFAQDDLGLLLQRFGNAGRQGGFCEGLGSRRAPADSDLRCRTPNDPAVGPLVNARGNTLRQSNNRSGPRDSVALRKASKLRSNRAFLRRRIEARTFPVQTDQLGDFLVGTTRGRRGVTSRTVRGSRQGPGSFGRSFDRETQRSARLQVVNQQRTLLDAA